MRDNTHNGDGAYHARRARQFSLDDVFRSPARARRALAGPAGMSDGPAGYAPGGPVAPSRATSEAVKP